MVSFVFQLVMSHVERWWICSLSEDFYISNLMVSSVVYIITGNCSWLSLSMTGTEMALATKTFIGMDWEMQQYFMQHLVGNRSTYAIIMVYVFWQGPRKKILLALELSKWVHLCTVHLHRGVLVPTCCWDSLLQNGRNTAKIAVLCCFQWHRCHDSFNALFRVY